MFFDTNIEKVLEIFIKSPTKGVQVRDVIRQTQLGNPTVLRALNKLEFQGILIKKEGRIYPYYEAKLDSSLFKRIKLAYTLLTLDTLIDMISKKTRPNCIILFGSAAKGEDTEKSDIDLFVQAKMQQFDAAETEKQLGRKINILFEPEIKTISTELKNNLANGIVLYGYLEVVQ